MTGRKRKGYSIVIVLVLMAAIAAEMYVLTGISNVILFQTRDAYLRSVEQNLAASGLIWARKNIGMENSDKTAIQLDLTDMKIKRAALSVLMESGQNEEAKVQIIAGGTFGRQSFKHNKKYQMKL